MIDQLRILVPEVGNLLIAQNHIISTAESCTGGGLSYWLTSLPGSSAWFDRGFVTYSNEAKIDMLGIENYTLDAFGAVSEATALEMAEAAVRHSRASVGLAITGIAGPDGGSPDKPVGTVWIAHAKNHMPVTEIKAQHHVFTGDRQHIRLSAMVAALEQLLTCLKNSQA